MSSLDRNSGTPRGAPALASSTDTSGTSDKRPVLIQHAGQGALFVDHECFTQAWTSCLEPGHSVVKEPVGKPSLWRTRVPKPTWISSFCTYRKRKWKKGERRCACAHKQLVPTHNCLSPRPHADKGPFLPRLKSGVSWPSSYEVLLAVVGM